MILVTTTRFVTLTNRVATSLGLPECRVVVVEHRLGGVAEHIVSARADDLVEPMLNLLCRR